MAQKRKKIKTTPFEIDYIKNLLIHNTNNKKYVIGKCFFVSESSSNYEKCIEA
jgi:hypothetical protein